MKLRNLVSGVTATLLVLAPGLPAVSSSSITNGTFETGEAGDTEITGWTSITERVDLGVTEIGGCVSVDTSDYSSLRLRTGRTPADLPVNDDLEIIWAGPEDVESAEEFWDDFGYPSNPFFKVELLDGSDSDLNDEDEEVDFRREDEGKVLKLFSEMDADEAGGYVVHGPAVVSSEFTARTIDDLSFEWAAIRKRDDFHIFGYLLNTETCSQTEVIDATGQSTPWTTVNVPVPSNGNYVFVFVSGSFDYNFGGGTGASLYIDNVMLSVNEEREAEEAAEEESRTPSSPVSPKVPTVSQFAAGPMFVTPGQSASLSGSRLNCTTFVVIGSQRTTFSYSTLPGGYGQLQILVPANLAPGKHSLRMDSCGGEVTYINSLVVSKPTIMKEGRFSSRVDQANQVREIRRWVLENRSDYNTVQCISNTNVSAQERARQFANDICKQALGLLASPKGSEIEVRDKSTHIAVWYRIFLTNK
jgi:hypothetical protein